MSKKLKSAIKNRNIEETLWELISQTVTSIEAGEDPAYTRSILTPLLRSLTSFEVERRRQEFVKDKDYSHKNDRSSPLQEEIRQWLQ